MPNGFVIPHFFSVPLTTVNRKVFESLGFRTKGKNSIPKRIQFKEKALRKPDNKIQDIYDSNSRNSRNTAPE